MILLILDHDIVNCSKSLNTPGGELLVDFSKNRINQDVMDRLFALVSVQDSMFVAVSKIICHL